jgi:hypothetical protein
VRRPPVWIAVLLATFGLAALYAGPLRTGFLNDDFLFLEEARTRPLAESLTRLGALGNYYRPLSRQIYFEALTPLAGAVPLAGSQPQTGARPPAGSQQRPGAQPHAGARPLVFHAFNFVLFVAALALLMDLLIALVPAGAAMAGALWFATLPFQRVNQIWISCSQDLFALTFALAALALHRRGRVAPAALATLLAFASKESALPIAAGLIAWDRWIAGRAWREAVRRATPALVATVAWLGAMLAMRALHPGSAAFVRWSPGDFVAGYLHGLQSLLGLEHPPGIVRGLLSRGPDLLALGAFALLALWVAPGRGAPATDGAGDRAADGTAAVDGAPAETARETLAPSPVRPAPRAVAAFAAAWLVAFGFVIGPVAHAWSSYFYTLFAVGGATLVALLLRRIGRASWLALVAVLLWWHAGATATRAFAVSGSPWVWTSHLTSFYFERVAALTRDLSVQLKRRVPDPAPGSRFFFATLPPFAGFQMGNGALIRSLYGDPTLESHFFSQFSESTAAGRDAHILYWDGAELRPLYENTADVLFQIGTDLLALDRPRDAAWAFRAGIERGESREDHLYWLGWAELWSGRRAAAEAAWIAWGARDDSVRWHARLRDVQTVHVHSPGDTVAMQRLLLEAIGAGMGRPEGHATLGVLLRERRPKFGVLELKVAAYLDPNDVRTRRELVLGLAEARLDDAAARELAAYRSIARSAGADSAIAAVAKRLAPGRGREVVEF